jgi:Fur family peroxide stress response transcriptional regulator
MSFATVYNTLDSLREKGYLLELTIDPAKKRFDPCTELHHHLICTSCRKVRDIHKDFALDLPDQTKGDFSITGNHIEFYGICAECRSRH